MIYNSFYIETKCLGLKNGIYILLWHMLTSLSTRVSDIYMYDLYRGKNASKVLFPNEKNVPDLSSMRNNLSIMLEFILNNVLEYWTQCHRLVHGIVLLHWTWLTGNFCHCLTSKTYPLFKPQSLPKYVTNYNTHNSVP